jgi:mRNA-degrading endonuclease RelE of RelBE toxin-antitoxin system
MSPSQSSYRLEIPGKYLKIWHAFESEMPEAIGRCRQFLINSPEDRLKSGGRLKKLKGELAGILQYDLTGEARVWYTVDKKTRTVRIKYIGHHP